MKPNPDRFNGIHPTWDGLTNEQKIELMEQARHRTYSTAPKMNLIVPLYILLGVPLLTAIFIGLPYCYIGFHSALAVGLLALCLSTNALYLRIHHALITPALIELINKTEGNEKPTIE